MPIWSPHDQTVGYSASSKWTEEAAMASGTEKGGSSNTAMPTPGTSSAIDASLPVPVLQNTGNYSVSSRRKKKSARVGGLAVHWARFKRRVGTGTAPSSSSLIGESAAENSYTRRMEEAARSDNEEVNEVVVDRVWSEDIKSSITHSEHGASPEKSGGSHPIGPSTSDHESLVPEGFFSTWMPLVFLRWRLCPAIVEVFSSSFVDEKSENHYAQV